MRTRNPAHHRQRILCLLISQMSTWQLVIITAQYGRSICQVLVRAPWRQCFGSGRDVCWRRRLTHWSWRRRSTRRCLPSHHNVWQRRSGSYWLAAARWSHIIVYIAIDGHLAFYVLVKDGVATCLVFCLATLVVLLFTSTTDNTIHCDLFTITWQTLHKKSVLMQQNHAMQCVVA